MTSQQWLADYLEQGRPGALGPGPYVPDVASADAARRLRDLLAEPDGWAEPPAGLLDEILASMDSERVAQAGLPRPVAVPGPAAGRDARRPDPDAPNGPGSRCRAAGRRRDRDRRRGHSRARDQFHLPGHLLMPRAASFLTTRPGAWR